MLRGRSAPRGLPFNDPTQKEGNEEKRSKKVERPSVPKPYSLTHDLLPVFVCRHNARDVGEVNWDMGKDGDNRVRSAVCSNNKWSGERDPPIGVNETWR